MRALGIAIASGLIALLPSAFIGMAAFEIPPLRALVTERVCGPGSELVHRATTLSGVRRTTTFLCRGADGRLSDPVTFAVIAQGAWLAWVPITTAIGGVWWVALLVRGGAAGRRAGRAAPRGAAADREVGGPSATVRFGSSVRVRVGPNTRGSAGDERA